MDIYHIIKRPLVTEKGTHQSTQRHDATKWERARGGSYSFEVHPDASKPEIKQAIEKIYAVKVLDVRTSNRRGKARRVRFKTGKTADWKKAIVVLDGDSHIDLF
ncbi:MAG TPA: 50S ribosomal protein L23 [Phycisphaerae bacterium]|nr:50S ribosomal protein L23 [Phycisphaerales bacterium]HRX86435.1 50S ribosomal protein L23 [Phycisphaerae bacterium]